MVSWKICNPAGKSLKAFNLSLAAVVGEVLLHLDA